MTEGTGTGAKPLDAKPIDTKPIETKLTDIKANEIKTLDARPIRGVLFDLDGTLVDTAPDLVLALNLALKDFGLPGESLENIRFAASHGSLALVNAAQPHLNDEEKATIQQGLLDHYHKVNGQAARLFDGMVSLLDHLNERRIPFGVVTNKAARFARPLLHRLELAHKMPAIISGDSTTQSKPHPAPMRLAASQLSVCCEQILYLGDAKRDLEAARNSDMLGGIAHWGYIGNNDQAHLWPHDFGFDTPLAVLELLKQG
ncbi:HAD-IA family hydrolase [Shewanella insulae]|uniref:HAD family hydrolase n=1 Tax=Shewanella insulae TaxID=2681496 RepID=UPI001EFD6185|nr:HAD-IA family hydrolase [Shewanella insulae]MCG9736630.1 HAD-IA family hydrolase [Shewanella insulae]